MRQFPLIVPTSGRQKRIVGSYFLMVNKCFLTLFDRYYELPAFCPDRGLYPYANPLKKVFTLTG
ncbi:MAG: hypothetical protein RL732_1527 [Bacteroidota bacterium]